MSEMVVGAVGIFSLLVQYFGTRLHLDRQDATRSKDIRAARYNADFQAVEIAMASSIKVAFAVMESSVTGKVSPAAVDSARERGFLVQLALARLISISAPPYVITSWNNVDTFMQTVVAETTGPTSFEMADLSRLIGDLFTQLNNFKDELEL